MGGHLAFAPLAHAVTFFGLRQYDRRASAAACCRVIGGINFQRIMTAAPQPVDVGVGQIRDQRLQLGIFVEEMFAIKTPVGGGIFLQLAIDGFVQALQQHAFFVARE